MSYSSNVFGSWIILGYLLNFIAVSSQESFSLHFLREPVQRLYLQRESTNHLDCTYEGGGGAIEHLWYRNETAVDEQILRSFPNGTLNFDVSDGDSPNPYFEGFYRCCITNGTSTLCGTASQVSYPVLGPVLLVTSRTTAALGGTFRLACSVEGDPTPSIRWYRDGEALQTMGNRFIILPNNAIQISQVELVDQGSYVCSAGNLAGSTISPSVAVAVTKMTSDPLNRGQILNITSREIFGRVGGDAFLECLVRDVQGVGLHWMKGTENIHEDRWETIGHGNLLLKNLSLNDTGTYVCTSYDSIADKVRTAAVSLTVQAPPAIISVPDIVSPPREAWTRSEGLNAIFHCKVSGVPTPSVIWYRDGARMPLGGRFSKTYSTSLWVRNLQLGDTGVYQCFVSSPLGSVYATSYLRVTRSDMAPMENLQVVSTTAKSVTIQWSVPAHVQPFRGFLVRYTRLPDGIEQGDIKNISSMKRAWNHTLTKLQAYSNYSISVRTYGPAKLSREAIVHAMTRESVPSAAPEITNLTSTSTTLTATWEPVPKDDLNGALLYTEICLERQQSDSLCVTEEALVVSYTFISLQPGVEYLVRLAAATNSGRGPFSLRHPKITPIGINCTTPEIVPFVSKIANSSFVMFTWPPLGGAQQDLVRGYRLIISIVTQHLGSVRVDFVSLGPEAVSYNKSNAVQHSMYRVKFYAFGECGEGPVSESVIQMPEEVSVDLVDVVPHNIKAQALSADMIRIVWDPPLAEEPVVSYLIEYRVIGEPAESQTSLSAEAILLDLETYTLYQIKITAIFAWREAASELHYCRTAEGAPDSPPINVRAVAVDSSSLNVSWDRPRVPNGVIVSYMLYYSSPARAMGGRKNVTKRIYEDRRTGIWLLLDGLRPDTHYSIRVAALTRPGRGPFSPAIDVYTLRAKDGLQFFSQASDVRKGILIGICLAILCIIVCVSLLCYHRRVSCRCYNAGYPNRVVSRVDVPLQQGKPHSYRRREGYPLRRSRQHSWSISEREIESLVMRDLGRQHSDRRLVQVHRVDSDAPVRGAHHREPSDNYLCYHPPCEHTSQQLPHQYPTDAHTSPAHPCLAEEVCRGDPAGPTDRDPSSSTNHSDNRHGREDWWSRGTPPLRQGGDMGQRPQQTSEVMYSSEGDVLKPDATSAIPSRDRGTLAPPMYPACRCSPYKRRRWSPKQGLYPQEVAGPECVNAGSVSPTGYEVDDSLSDSSSRDRDSGLNRDITEHSFGGCDTSPDFLERAIELLSTV